MAAYRIHCTTSPLGPSRFLVTVAAVPAATASEAAQITAETRAFASAELAKAESPKMCEAMKARIAAQGHEVRSVDYG